MAKTILVVDDTASLRKMVKSYLSQEGFEVVTAAAGPEALMVARQTQPNLIVLDLMMPEMSGMEFLRAYSSMSQLSSLPHPQTRMLLSRRWTAAPMM